MEVKYAIAIIAIFTFSIIMVVIFVGCNASNPEFDFNGNGAESIPKQCEEFNDPRQFQKCVNKATYKESLCTNLFFWLRY